MLEMGGGVVALTMAVVLADDLTEYEVAKDTDCEEDELDRNIGEDNDVDEDPTLEWAESLEEVNIPSTPVAVMSDKADASLVHLTT